MEKYTYEDLQQKYGNLINKILHSQKLKDRASNFFDKEAEYIDDVLYVVNVIRGVEKYRGRVSSAIPDNTIKKGGNPLRNPVYLDAKLMLDELDAKTGFKHKIIEKVNSQQKHVKEFEGRSHVASRNGSVEINLNFEPLLNTRWAIPHELMHAIDDKRLGKNGRDNQFLGELIGVGTDIYASKWLAEKYPEHKAEYSYLMKDGGYNLDISKANEAYADYLICKVVTSNGDEQVRWSKELVNMYNQQPRCVEHCAEKAVKFIEDKFNQIHYEPMYEARYLTTSAIVDYMYGNFTPIEVMDRLLNYNEHTTDAGYRAFDDVTNKLGTPPVKECASLYAEKINHYNSMKNRALEEKMTKK